MRIKCFLSFLLPLCLLLGSGTSAFANEEAHETAAVEQHGEAGHEKKKLDVSGEIFSHVGDSHEWHIFSIGHTPVAVPLPVILYDANRGLQIFSSGNFNYHHWTPIEGTKLKRTESFNGYHLEKNIKEKIVADDGAQLYDFSITKNVLCMLISIAILLPLIINVAKKYQKNGPNKAPSGFQNALEPVITFVRDEVAKPNLGHKYMKFMPLLLTLFFFIWTNNLLGLLPFGFNFTGNIAVTVCLALVFFVVMLVNANKHFWSHLFNPPGVPMGINVLLVIIEVISLFVKPIALTIRLFANILAGHIVILSVIFMIFIFANISTGAGIGFSFLSIAFAIFMFFLELLVAAIQAFIFTNLTAVFLGQAVEEGHGHDDGQHHQVSENEIIA
jgi:F-type H+-transporting ATPase subunit a